MIDGGMQRKPAIFALSRAASLAYWQRRVVQTRSSPSPLACAIVSGRLTMKGLQRGQDLVVIGF